MRIGLRILLGYMLVLGVLSATLVTGLPSIIRRALQSATGPVLAEQATRVGNRLGATRDPAALLRDMEGLMSAELMVTDASGKVVYEAVRPGGSGERAVSRLGQTLPRDLISSALEGKPRSFSRQLFDRQVVVGVAPWRQGGQISGAVVAWRPYLFDRASERAAITQIAIFALSGLGLAILLSLFLTQGIVRRLRRVGAAARALAEGDLTVRAPENDVDELGELGVSFNHMAERLQVVVEGLQKSERLRRELMAAISHELRTPITSIQGFAEALRDGIVTDPEKQQRYHAVIAVESERLGRLVRDLFDFAKLEAGQFDFRLVSLSPRPWLTEFAEHARTRLESQGLRLELWGDPGAEPILGDRQRLDQVMDNLVDNAARYSPPGGTITIRAEAQAGLLRLSVEDQGPGIKPEDLPHVFERFFQGTTPGKKAGGAGLGLAIAQSIVTGHRGQIGVESQPGQGARFWFTLPRTPA